MKSDGSECAALLTLHESPENANEPTAAESTKGCLEVLGRGRGGMPKGCGTLLELADMFDLLTVVMVRQGRTHHK